jgi:ethanolamine utilization protein EutP
MAVKKVLLVGKAGSGKTSLIQSLQGHEVVYRKTQAIVFDGIFVDSPGEFLENRRLLPALLTSSTNCQIVALVQDATGTTSSFSPGFASMFNKRVVGIVTKTDKESGCPERAEEFLRRAGVKDIIRTSAVDKTGLDRLKLAFSREE